MICIVLHTRGRQDPRFCWLNIAQKRVDQYSFPASDLLISWPTVHVDVGSKQRIILQFPLNCTDQAPLLHIFQTDTAASVIPVELAVIIHFCHIYVFGFSCKGSFDSLLRV